MAAEPSGLAMPRGAGAAAGQTPLLSIENLDVYYGSAHALQGVSLSLAGGVLAVVGRNGMGKTTLCNALTGLIPARGRIVFEGRDILGLPPHRITELGIAYVPQGRRVWPSLSVDEHLRLASVTARRGDWTVDRVYQVFPRLAERKHNGGAQLSGGEQQMLAIARALLFNPRLLVMDEPTEGLAPVIVGQVAAMLKTLAAEGTIAVLLVEQNLGVAIDVADTVAVMVNGRVAHVLPASGLAADVALQQRLLGVRQSGEAAPAQPPQPEAGTAPATAAGAAVPEVRVMTVRRAGGGQPLADVVTDQRPTRWGATPEPGDAFAPAARAAGDGKTAAGRPAATADPAAAAGFAYPVSASADRAAYVVGTFDTKARDLNYLRDCLQRLGVRTVTVDVSTSGAASSAMVSPRDVARHHPDGEAAVFTGDRGSAVMAMAIALERFVLSRRDLGGIISAGGSGGTALATRAMRALPVGVPKIMVSTVASGNIKPYVGPSDVCMMYSVTDVSGINRISARVLGNAAHALAGMLMHEPAPRSDNKPAIGMTMFGVTTPCVQAVARALESQYDCLIFHATGTGGQSMEKLVESGLLAAVVDVSTTEIADEVVGGVFSAGPQRMDAVIASGLPYVGSCGALDMVNFHAMDTVPEAFRSRNLYRHNANVTLMRTTPQECARIGEFIAGKLNRMTGPVRFLIPEGGVSLLDAPGQPFWDPQADAALFDAIERHFVPTAQRRLQRLPFNINAPEFADALVAALHEAMAAAGGARIRT